MLREIPSARLFEEVLKLFLSGYAAYTFEMLVDLQLFDPLFPASAEVLEYNPTYTHTLISEALVNTDLRIKQNKPVTPAFLFAALLWPALPKRVMRLQDRGMPAIPAMQEAAHELIAEQCQRIAIPKRFTMPSREMIKELSSKGEVAGDGPKKRRRSSGSKRKRSAGDASSASGE